MAEKNKKIKDMVIAIFCTILAILCIVFYFLPAFNVKDTPALTQEFKTSEYSAFDITRVMFLKDKYADVPWAGLTYIKDAFGIPVFLAGALTPLAILCCITTAVFAYLSWLKSESFKKYCFLFSLCGMIFQTISLITVWFMALQIRSDTEKEVLNLYFDSNMKGGMSYASFVSLILAFVIAIIACAYNYFLENFDDEEDEEDYEDEYDEDDDDDEYEEVIIRRKKKKTPAEIEDGSKKASPEPDTKANNEGTFVKVKNKK